MKVIIVKPWELNQAINVYKTEYPVEDNGFVRIQSVMEIPVTEIVEKCIGYRVTDDYLEFFNRTFEKEDSRWLEFRKEFPEVSGWEMRKIFMHWYRAYKNT